MGWPIVIDSAISAPAAGNTFTFQPKPGGGDLSANFQVLTGTTISADLQISHDGGTTWSILAAAALSGVPPTAGSTKTITPVISGALYRLNYTTATGTIAVRVTSN